jgi:hypothetical protein
LNGALFPQTLFLSGSRNWFSERFEPRCTFEPKHSVFIVRKTSGLLLPSVDL